MLDQIDLLGKSRNLEASITKLTKAVTVDAFGVIAAINGIEDSLSRF
jgi:hypothetical protein